MLKKVAVILFLVASFACKKSSDQIQAGALDINFPSAYFTDYKLVGKSMASPVIMDKLIGMIDATPSGAEIHLAIYGFDHKGIIDALRRAADRKVVLHLLVDYSLSETEEQNRPTVIIIRSFLRPDSELTTVKNDVTVSSIHHDKYVLFSALNTKTGIAKNVVFSTSHNFTVADSKKVQDAVVFNQPELYQAFISNFKETKSRAAGGMKNFTYQVFTNPANDLTVQFYPKRKNGVNYTGDTIIELLDGITDPATATVRVGMSDWTVSRLNVVQKLQELRSKGAKVEVIAKSKADEQILTGLDQLSKSGGFVNIYQINKTNIHSKFFIIEGKYNGKDAKIVATGSHNLTGNALYNNNETLMILHNYNAIYDSYVNYFNELKKL